MALNNFLFIHVGSISLKIEEGSHSVSGDPAGLGESENEKVVSVEPSLNRSGFCKENSKNVNYLKIFCLNPFFVRFVVLGYVLKTVEEKVYFGTEAFGGPADLGESKDEGIAFVKPSPNRNEVCKENSKTKNVFY